VNVFVSIFDCRNNSDDLVVIMRIEEFYFDDVLSIRIVAFYNIDKTRKIDKINRI